MKRFLRILLRISLLIVLLLLIYILSFSLFYPGPKEYKNKAIDITSWNTDGDIYTIESDYRFFRNEIKYKEFKSDSQFINLRIVDNKKQFERRKGDTISYNYAWAAYVIINLFTLESMGKLELEDHMDEIDLAYNFLRIQAVIKDSTAAWPMNYKFYRYDLPFLWSSSYQHGLVMSALARYYQLTNDSACFDLIKKAVNLCKVGVKEEGILFEYGDQSYCYEEYPSIPPNSVLNGHIYTLFGLYDVYRVSQYNEAINLFNFGINYLEENLHKYDMGYWSYYDLQTGFAASYAYHIGTHIPQLKLLYQITGKEIFKEYVDKWDTYFKEPYFTMFKFKVLKDAIVRRFIYKPWLSYG